MKIRQVPLWWLVLASLLALLSACATGPRTIEMSQDRLEAGLARRFPLETRMGGLFWFRIARPHLTLLPESNRLQLAFSIDASEPSMRSPLQGDLTVSFGLRFEPRDSTIRLASVRVESIDVPQLATRWRDLLSRNGPLLVVPLLEGMVVHTFQPEDLARAAGVVPGAILVTRRGIAIELLPAP